MEEININLCSDIYSIGKSYTFLHLFNCKLNCGIEFYFDCNVQVNLKGAGGFGFIWYKLVYSLHILANLKSSYTHKNNNPYFILFYCVFLSVTNTQDVWRPVTEHRPKKPSSFQYPFITEGLAPSVREDLKAKCCTKL